ncbi:MAG: hypothetical protein ABFS32_20880 [Bacteroidota bacterium]
MKLAFKFIPIILCFILMAAHLSRANMMILSVVCLVIPFILIWKSKISARVIQVALIIGGLEWIRTLIYYAQIRLENDQPWLRLAIIIGVVAIFNFLTPMVFRTKSMKERYSLR